LSVSYNLAATIFGGTAQLVVAWMINATGEPTSPAWYLFAVNLLTLVGLLKLKTRATPDPVSV
jgi:MHS family proline/betaine transporter-like MFS transporter